MSLIATVFVRPAAIAKVRLPNPPSVSVPRQPVSAPQCSLVGAVRWDVTLTDPVRIDSLALGPKSRTETGRDGLYVDPLPSWRAGGSVYDDIAFRPMTIDGWTQTHDGLLSGPADQKGTG